MFKHRHKAGFQPFAININACMCVCICVCVRATLVCVCVSTDEHMMEKKTYTSFAFEICFIIKIRFANLHLTHDEKSYRRIFHNNAIMLE